MSYHIHKFISNKIGYNSYEEYVAEYNDMVNFEKNYQEDFSQYTREMIEDEIRLEELLEKIDYEMNYYDED